MTKKTNIWDQIKANLRKGVSTTEFQTWLSGTSLKEINAREAVIEAPNKFIADWLYDNYRNQIQAFFKENLNALPYIRFTYPDTAQTIKTQNTELVNIPVLPQNHGIDPLTTFDDFVQDGSNRLVYTCALAVVERPGEAYNPFYIYSKLSLGKTHILHGIGNLVLHNNPGKSVIYLPACQLLTAFSSPVNNGETVPRFWERDHAPDFILIDDIHFVTAHPKAQAHLLALWNTYLGSSGQLVAAAACPPWKIHNLMPELRSRLESGLIAEIHPPGQKTKVKIIQHTAKKHNLPLPHDVAFFLANSTDNLKTLKQHVARLKDRFFSDRNPIDIFAAESIINAACAPDSVDIHSIQDITARYFNISRLDLLSEKRAKAFSYPRQVALYLSRQLTDLSLQEIGHAFGNKHHSTVIYAQKRIEQDKDRNEKISLDINNIRKLLLHPV